MIEEKQKIKSTYVDLEKEIVPVEFDLVFKDEDNKHTEYSLNKISDKNLKDKEKIERYEKKIKGLNKWLSRCKEGSKNSYKVKIKLQKAYQKLEKYKKESLTFSK